MAAAVVTVEARCVDATRCPFAGDRVAFALRPGAVAWLRGPSGAGKTTLSGAVAGLCGPRQLRRLGVAVTVDWSRDVPPGERCGAVFQATTLIDSLSLGANVVLALRNRGHQGPGGGTHADEAKRLVEAVGLDWARDAWKMPTELSGGMARRGSLALAVAQGKRVLVLDEPFTGLDEGSARAVAAELRKVREAHGTALLLISHQPDLAKLVCDEATTEVIRLEPRSQDLGTTRAPPATRTSSSLSSRLRSLDASRFIPRFAARLYDYLFYSLPLILTAFTAAGLAIAMLSADLLTKLDVKPHVLAVVDRDVLPLVDALLGKEAPALQRSMTKVMVRQKALGLVDDAFPRARRTMYSLGLVKLFVLELGPLLTALLLSGRIGGSYAGDVATMEASAQNKLLRTLGVSPRRWALLPAALAALVAGPLLTVLGTSVAILLGGPVAGWYGLGGDLDGAWYAEGCREALLPPLRLDFATKALASNVVELATWPPAHHLLKATTFIALILALAELLARPTDGRNLTHRAVPSVITAAVVLGGLAVILADWAFSQLLLLRE